MSYHVMQINEISNASCLEIYLGKGKSEFANNTTANLLNLVDCVSAQWIALELSKYLRKC